MVKKIYILLGIIVLMSSCDRSATNRNESDPGFNTDEYILLDKWPLKGPELLWKCKGLGKGYGAPAISDKGIFINAEENGHSYTLRLDHDGNIRWRSPNGKEFSGIDFTASYPGTRSAPTIKGKLVYALSGMGQLSCFDIRSGKVIWTVDLIGALNGLMGDFGFSDSPLVDNNRVYCFPGGDSNNHVALDRYTGELLWSSIVKKDHYSYSTPILVSLEERDVLIGTSRNYIYVLDIENGTLLSTYQLEDIKYGYEHCNPVIYKDGFIYFVPSEKDSQGSVKLRLSQDGRELSEIWRNSEVVNVFEGFVIFDSLLYTCLDNKKLVALHTGTGKIIHSVRASNGGIVYADKKIFIYGHNGKMQLFNLTNGKPEFRSEFRIIAGNGHHFSFPRIVNGIMYIRRGDTLMAYKLHK